MNTREEIIRILENNKGELISGEYIAGKLNITRNAVWKNIISLQNMGYNIENKSGKGYILSRDNDVITSEGIKKYLLNDDVKIVILDKIDSTNDYLKKNIDLYKNEWTIVIALEQTNGKGRLGRNFYSPKDSGIYFSILLKPKFGFEYSTFITTSCAVSVCKAIKKVFPSINPYIKWVNDIIVNDKKVCGILTEGQINVETKVFDYAIVGIGLNLYFPSEGFPNELNRIASSLLNDKVGDAKNLLIGTIINEYREMYSLIGKDNNIAKEYRDMNYVIGKEINMIKGNIIKSGIVKDIDEQCRLIVENDIGEKDILDCGEISIKIK